MRILRELEACKKLGIARSTLRRAIERGEIPPPIKITDYGRTIGFIEAELDQYIERRSAKRAGRVGAENGKQAGG